VAVVRGAGERGGRSEAAEKVKADYSRWIVCFFITQQKTGYPNG
jgi:hypothetical protein